MKKKWVIRIALFKNSRFHETFANSQFLGLNLEAFITEHLRYMGLVRIIRNADDLVFDVYPPKDESADGGKLWAETKSERLRSFSMNAVASPEVN